MPFSVLILLSSFVSKENNTIDKSAFVNSQKDYDFAIIIIFKLLFFFW